MKCIEQQSKKGLVPVESHTSLDVIFFYFYISLTALRMPLVCADVTSSQGSTGERRLKRSWLSSPLCVLLRAAIDSMRLACQHGQGADMSYMG